MLHVLCSSETKMGFSCAWKMLASRKIGQFNQEWAKGWERATNSRQQWIWAHKLSGTDTNKAERWIPLSVHFTAILTITIFEWVCESMAVTRKAKIWNIFSRFPWQLAMQWHANMWAVQGNCGESQQTQFFDFRDWMTSLMMQGSPKSQSSEVIEYYHHHLIRASSFYFIEISQKVGSLRWFISTS